MDYRYETDLTRIACAWEQDCCSHCPPTLVLTDPRTGHRITLDPFEVDEFVDWIRETGQVWGLVPHEG